MRLLLLLLVAELTWNTSPECKLQTLDEGRAVIATVEKGDGLMTLSFSNPGKYFVSVVKIGDNLDPLNPDVPVEPTLCSKIDAVTAAGLREAYSSQANVLAETGMSVTVDQFWSSHDGLLKRKGLLENAAQKEIEARIDHVLGSKNVRISDELRIDLVSCLRDIASELQCGTIEPIPADPEDPVDPTDPDDLKVTRVVYIYEKDDTAVPPGVLAALDELNRDGIQATTFEEDTKNSEGEVPLQYRSALMEAQRIGLPSLVILSKDTVIRTLRNPLIKEQVLEVVR